MSHNGHLMCVRLYDSPTRGQLPLSRIDDDRRPLRRRGMPRSCSELDEATLDEAALEEATLDEAALDEATLNEATLEEAALDEAEIFEANVGAETATNDDTEQHHYFLLSAQNTNYSTTRNWCLS